MEVQQTDFQRWLGASGYPIEPHPEDFPRLWAEFEAWQRRNEPPAEAIVLADCDAERWPNRVFRCEVPA
ncbi:MAG: hypothetical protein ACTHK7_21645 [Aureliella sp.]